MINESDIQSLNNVKIGLAGEHQKGNAALAKKLCLQAVKSLEKKGIGLFKNESAVVEGLEKTVWPGRCQIYQSPKFKNTTWYLDGAHTLESLKAAGEWFDSCCSESP